MGLEYINPGDKVIGLSYVDPGDAAIDLTTDGPGDGSGDEAVRSMIVGGGESGGIVKAPLANAGAAGICTICTCTLSFMLTGGGRSSVGNPDALVRSFFRGEAASTEDPFGTAGVLAGTES